VGEIGFQAGIVRHLESLLATNFPSIPHDVVKFYSNIRVLLRVKALNKVIEDKKFVETERARRALQESENSYEDVIVNAMTDSNEDRLAELAVLENDFVQVSDLLENALSQLIS
jgi:hypothetical protein